MEHRILIEADHPYVVKCCKLSPSHLFDARVRTRTRTRSPFAMPLASMYQSSIAMADDAYETDDRMYLFLEIMEGGELFDRIVDMGHFTEKSAQDVTYKLLGALRYMHDKVYSEVTIQLPSLAQLNYPVALTVGIVRCFCRGSRIATLSPKIC